MLDSKSAATCSNRRKERGGWGGGGGGGEAGGEKIQGRMGGGGGGGGSPKRSSFPAFTASGFCRLGELSPLREAERRSGELAPKTNTWWRCCLLLPAGGGDYFVQTPRRFLASARTPPTSQYFSPKSPPADYITVLLSRRYCAHKTARWNKDGHFWWLAF